MYFTVELVHSGKVSLVRGETIGDLKNQIQEKHNIPSDEQILLYKDKLMLQNDKKLATLQDTLADRRMMMYTKQDNETELQVQILCNSPTRENFTLEATCGKTVLILKEQINQEIGVSPHRLRLSIMGHVLNDRDVLRNYIATDTPNFTLDVLPADEANFGVFLQTNKGLHCFTNLEVLDTIYTLEFRYHQRLNPAPDYYFHFTWEGNRLLGPLTFQHYNIPSGATIGLVEISGYT